MKKVTTDTANRSFLLSLLYCLVPVALQLPCRIFEALRVWSAPAEAGASLKGLGFCQHSYEGKYYSSSHCPLLYLLRAAHRTRGTGREGWGREWGLACFIARLPVYLESCLLYLGKVYLNCQCA